MLFQTWEFAVFFAVVYAVYLAVKRTTAWQYWLLIASYVFYGWFSPWYLILITYSTAVDFLMVVLMSKGRRKKPWLTVSIINNLGLLGFFKYGAFVADNVTALLAWLGIPYAVSAPNWLLPIGISFYVFQSLSYTIDYYRGKIEREDSYLRYATFVSMFPRLMMGPIERAGNLLPQMHKPVRITSQDVADGASLFVVGLFKKIALADYLAQYVDTIYACPEEHHSPALLLAAFAYTWQIYFDFSGYTDMARGLARLLGFRLMLNFNNPYLATGLGEFWERWHISLSTWFKDYVYIPLGGNRKGGFRTYVNMILTMLISGLWHGAAWTFVIWGAVHAFGRVLTRELERTAFYRDRVPRFAKQMLVFTIVAFAWIFFRAESFEHACRIISGIFTAGWADPKFPMWALTLTLAVWAYQFAYESRLRWLLELGPVRVALVVLMILYMAIFCGGQTQGFIYLQF
ncbi:MAG: MBOAT family protein [Phycisphaerae bacterium]|nr:MBOAT family protein [Phycisphaerae bacterium]